MPPTQKPGKPLYRIKRKPGKPAPISHWIEEDYDPRDALRVKEQLAMAFYDDPDGRRMEARPFLKWVGGKTSLLGQLDEFFPHEIDRYIEPFLGAVRSFFT